MLASYHYHKGGPLQTLRYGNGLQTECHYQEDGSPADLVTMTAQGNVLLNLRYAYDGNCTEKSGEPYQNTYTYDRMNRLTGSIQDGKGVRYAYDPAGNRLKKETGQETETYHYNAKNQLIERHTREGVIRYNYDPQGNLLEEQGEIFRKQYAYDAAGRQISVAVSESAGGGDGAGSFVQLNRYDGENLRYETEENGKVIRFLFDRGELAEERREDAQIRYIKGYDPLLLIQDGEEQSRFSFVQDETGSTLFLLDEAHEIRKSYRYDVFGDILQETGDIPNRLTYTGQIYDGVAGQYYLRARFYNPVVGRFLQEDVYRGDGLNLYAHCANNPVMYYDPSEYIGICPQKKLDTYKKDNPLEDENLKAIYDKWIKSGISEEEALKYLQKFGSRPDIEHLPYIDQLAAQAYQNVLSQKNYGLPPSMYELLDEKSYLKDAFIGTAVDWEFKKLVKESAFIPEEIYTITKQGVYGADLIYAGDMKGFEDQVWVDLTTKNQADRHFGHYKGNGYVTAYR